MKNYTYPGLWAVFILVLSIGPSPNLPDTLDFEPDKLAHAFVYGVLVYLALRACQKASQLNQKNIITVVVLSILYGLLLEIVQKTFFPYRYFEWGDVLANTIGAILGWRIFQYFYNQKKA